LAGAAVDVIERRDRLGVRWLDTAFDDEARLVTFATSWLERAVEPVRQKRRRAVALRQENPLLLPLLFARYGRPQGTPLHEPAGWDAPTPFPPFLSSRFKLVRMFSSDAARK
jgi:hypothetical protein